MLPLESSSRSVIAPIMQLLTLIWQDQVFYYLSDQAYQIRHIRSDVSDPARKRINGYLRWLCPAFERRDGIVIGSS
jgi:hypothetical protein